jgi:hypothetical protein
MFFFSRKEASATKHSELIHFLYTGHRGYRVWGIDTGYRV